MKKVIKKREREREIKGRKVGFTFEDNGNPAANTSDALIKLAYTRSSQVKSDRRRCFLFVEKFMIIL